MPACAVCAVRSTVVANVLYSLLVAHRGDDVTCHAVSAASRGCDCLLHSNFNRRTCQHRQLLHLPHLTHVATHTHTPSIKNEPLRTAAAGRQSTATRPRRRAARRDVGLPSAASSASRSRWLAGGSASALVVVALYEYDTIVRTCGRRHPQGRRRVRAHGLVVVAAMQSTARTRQTQRRCRPAVATSAVGDPVPA